MAELKRAVEVEAVEQVLPLVLEVIPGQAGEGLIDVYEPGTYEGQTLRKLCEKTLDRKDWSIEELQIVEDIHRQLSGGRLLCRGRPIEGSALDFAVLEETEAGEKYLYVPIRAIKPQEGGLPRTIRALARESSREMTNDRKSPPFGKNPPWPPFGKKGGGFRQRGVGGFRLAGDLRERRSGYSG